MQAQDKAQSALLAVFPTLEALASFSANRANLKILRSIVNWAARSGIIPGKDEPALAGFIGRHARTAEDCSPPAHLTFEDLLLKKRDLLDIHLSLRALTERINALLAEQRIDLPKVGNSMLTRLKKEPADTSHKRGVLRSLAFWMGYERGHLGPSWNYESLLKLCRQAQPTAHFKEGVRIGIALFSRGDVIDHEIVGWLKKALKSHIEQSIGSFSHGRWGKVKAHDITTLYVDFPMQEEAGNPAAYRQCLCSAVSVAHQVAIRWALSRYCGAKRFLSIGIAAGDYAVMDNYLLPVLAAKLPGDPVIRITDYARQCMLINDIRVVLCSRPFETVLFTGETLSIWWLVGLWSTIYYDFIPDLLQDEILQNEPAAVEALGRLFWLPREEGSNIPAAGKANAVITFLRSPHNSLLGIEVAKTLYYRRRFWEAMEVLRIVLSIDAAHLIARTLRMALFRNLALDASSYAVACGLLRQALQEAHYIRDNCAGQAEDFYCEYAVVHLAKAMLTVRYLRSGHGAMAEARAVRQARRSVYLALDRAQALFGMGLTVSPSGIRSAYLLNSARLIEAILKKDKEILVNPQKPIDTQPEIIRRTCEDLLSELGYLREELPPQSRYAFIEKRFHQQFIIHDGSISLPAYRPTVYYCSAVALWDFLPVRSMGLAKRCLQLLNECVKMAQAVEKDDLCIYSFTRTYGEMMPAAEFIRHMQKAIRLIEDITGKDLPQRHDSEVIPPRPDSSSLLLILNF